MKANELRIHDKSLRAAIKQELSPDLDFENKINANAHPNIGSLKTAIEKE